VDKMREKRLRWLGHVMRREEISTIRVVMKVNVEGKEEEKTEKEMVGKY